ncbi:probable mitochondrial glutathione transporter SLC25A40 [Macrosteles quadrilineatus]|uniref:probable mitochondrial glutathione transporter SLC25A40 n=1 Tax=Macrosteles quadrilineatus TaxID=74068 RepID=UPI0023E1756A|nr:probable mitochondrial glutathione transporter SLC25A40 [Macrosteles quadrilineatus]XP_054280879.1 probable mitochondrial glutathione transporter SLC25A40 [Macrosteles quadrilineatus]
MSGSKDLSVSDSANLRILEILRPSSVAEKTPVMSDNKTLVLSDNKELSISDPRFRITPYQQMAASTTGALATSLIMTPLDVVKIRLQTQKYTKFRITENKPCVLYYCNGLMDHWCPCERAGNKWYNRPGNFNGTLDAIVKISRAEGVTSLWAGLSPTLVLALPATVVYFVTYEQLRTRLCDYMCVKREDQPIWIPMLSGGTARFWAVTIVNPLELMRTRMQAQKLSWRQIRNTFGDLLKKDGVKGLFKGLTPTLLRDVPFSGIYWATYETINASYPQQHQGSFGPSFLGGSLAGSIAALVTTPFDVVKTHQQVALAEELITKKGMKRSTFTIMKDIYRVNGLSGIFAGLTPRVLKVAPACAIMVSTFEYGKLFFQKQNYELYLLVNKHEL